jgi:hypothetical protein
MRREWRPRRDTTRNGLNPWANPVSNHGPSRILPGSWSVTKLSINKNLPFFLQPQLDCSQKKRHFQFCFRLGTAAMANHPQRRVFPASVGFPGKVAFIWRTKCVGEYRNLFSIKVQKIINLSKNARNYSKIYLIFCMLPNFVIPTKFLIFQLCLPSIYLDDFQWWMGALCWHWKLPTFQTGLQPAILRRRPYGLATRSKFVAPSGDWLPFF